jgi:hypothetical protein
MALETMVAPIGNPFARGFAMVRISEAIEGEK